jgi:hypothetical protein
MLISNERATLTVQGPLGLGSALRSGQANACFGRQSARMDVWRYAKVGRCRIGCERAHARGRALDWRGERPIAQRQGVRAGRRNAAACC